MVGKSVGFGPAMEVCAVRPVFTIAAAIAAAFAGVTTGCTSPALAQDTMFGNPWPETGSWGQAWGDEDTATAPSPQRVALGSAATPGAAAPLPVADMADDAVAQDVSSEAVVAPQREPSADAAGPDDETLETTLVAAYQSSPKLQAQRAALRVSDESVAQALAGWRPSLALSGNVARGDYYYNQYRDRDHLRTSTVYGLTFTQPLYQGGRTMAATDQAENNVRANRSQLQVVEQSVLVDAATAFLDTVRDQSVLELHAHQVSVLERELDEVLARRKVGEVTLTDVHQAEARLAQAVAGRIQAEGAVQNSQAHYVNVVGHAPGPLIVPAAPVKVLASFEQVRAAVLAQNPNVELSQWLARAAKDGVTVLYSELLPTVSLVARYNRDLHDTTSNSETTGAEVLLTASIPLYGGGGSYSRIREQKHTEGERQIQVEVARRDALEAAAREWDNLRAARAKTVSVQSQIAANEIALHGVREELTSGSRTVLDVLNAELELFDSKVSLEIARHDEMVAAFRLRSTYGEVTAQTLDLATDRYDPKRHYDEVRDRWIGADIGEAE